MTDERDPMELQPMQLEDVASNPLTPSTLGQAMQLSNMLAKSSLVPEAMQGKPVNVLMALMKGAEMRSAFEQWQDEQRAAHAEALAELLTEPCEVLPVIIPLPSLPEADAHLIAFIDECGRRIERGL